MRADNPGGARISPRRMGCHRLVVDPVLVDRSIRRPVERDFLTYLTLTATVVNRIVLQG